MQNHRPLELIFIDETGFVSRKKQNCFALIKKPCYCYSFMYLLGLIRCLSRKYGYSPKGQRAEVRRIRTNNRRITVISAIGYDGYLAVSVLEPGQKCNRIQRFC